jgi:archaellum component FlaC
MESTLENLWRQLNRLEDRLGKDSMFGLKKQVTTAREAIERSADHLQHIIRPDGTEERPSLFNVIYANRK